MNFPILSAIIFIPLIGALFILVTKGSQKNVEKKAFWPKYFGGRLKFVGNLRQLYSGIAFLTRENNSLYVNFIFFFACGSYISYKNQILCRSEAQL